MIIPLILIHLMVHIKMGVNVTCCSGCDTINSSYSLAEDMTYKDTFLSVMYSPIIVPTLYISEPLLKKYSDKYGAEIYQSGNIVIYGAFCLDNEKDEREFLKRKVVNKFDSYNFSYLYFFIVSNIVLSYFIWVYIIKKLEKYKKTRGILLSIFVLLLPYLILMYFTSIESISSVSYLKYIEDYSKYKENNFLIWNAP